MLGSVGKKGLEKTQRVKWLNEFIHDVPCLVFLVPSVLYLHRLPSAFTFSFRGDGW